MGSSSVSTDICYIYGCYDYHFPDFADIGRFVHLMSFFLQANMPTEAGHSSEIAASENRENSLPADENTPLVREANSTNRQLRICEHFNCRHFLLGVFLLFLFAEVALFTSVVIYGTVNVDYINTLEGNYHENYISTVMALNLVEIINCCFFLGIIIKSPSFAGFSTVVKDLCCLPNFWTLLLFFLLYLIGGSISIHIYYGLYKNCTQFDSFSMIYKCRNALKLAIVEIILEILNFFTMMILVVFLNHANIRYTISGSTWVYGMLKGALAMFCFRLFVPVVFNILQISTALIYGPNGNKDIVRAQIITEILLLPFCKKIIELLWQKIFLDEKFIIGKIRRNRGTRQITFVV